MEIIKKLILCLLFIACTPNDADIESKDIARDGIEVKDERKEFLDKLGYSESRNDYKKVNKYGYLGMYQFSQSTLRLLGIKVTKYQFLNNPQLQDDAVFLLLIANKKNLSKEIELYSYTTINGIRITESGILAAAHLVGSGDVKRWLKSKGDQTAKDALGTSIETYMRKFGGYNLNLPGTVKI